MRPSHPAPNAAPLTRKDLVPLNGRPNDALGDDRSAPTPRRRHAVQRTEPGPRLEQKTIRRAEARSSEGEVHFFLQRIAGGLYVEREETPRRGTRTSQSLVFDDRSSFERWCADDPVRFRHPLLHAQLKRDGDALWAVEP